MSRAAESAFLGGDAPCRMVALRLVAASNPLGGRGVGENHSRDCRKSEGIRKSLIAKGLAERCGSGPNEAPPTPLRKLIPVDLGGVAGGPSKNGEGFCQSLVGLCVRLWRSRRSRCTGTRGGS